MHAGTLRVLEFGRIVEAVSRLALTPLGAASLADLKPQTDPRAVQNALSTTSEVVNYLGDNPSISLEAPLHIDNILSGLAIEAKALEPLHLLKLSHFLASIEQTRDTIRRASGSFPVLHALAGQVSSFEKEITEIKQKIEPSGEVVDQASNELRVIRDRLRKQRARLRGTLESYIRGKDTVRYLQEQIITERAGRYVLIVRAEHRASIPGIVHGNSTSGASLFLEPLSTVETNNDIVALEENESAEIHQILLTLSNGLRKRALEIQRTLQAATELDVLQAKARFSLLINGVEPTLVTDGQFELRAARHPLMIQVTETHLETPTPERERTEPITQQPVPVDLLLSPPSRTLIVTGPNTGGKTVALKTVGLLALMAQAGLHLPVAPGSQLPVFRSIFADIGDEQSISASLSTFSSHVTNIASMEQSLVLPALVLLDEVGAGTDPTEGSALSMAIIEHFRQRGALVVATTHYDMLKSYALTSVDIACTAFGFDPETFAPTFQLVYGSAGRSLGLEIAERLGLTPQIIEAAREYQSARGDQLAEQLAKIDRDLQVLEQQRRSAVQTREELTKNETLLNMREAQLDKKEVAFQQRLNSGLERQFSEAKHEINKIIKTLKIRVAKLETKAAQRSDRDEQVTLSADETDILGSETRSAFKSITDRLAPISSIQSVDQKTQQAGTNVAGVLNPEIGDHVVVTTLGLQGVVRLVQGRVVEVDIRGKRLRVPFEELSGASRPPSQGTNLGVPDVHLQSYRDQVTELNVIGCTVDEALTQTGKFLDKALLSEQRLLRIIHGHGTGKLRRALAEFFDGHPLIEKFEAAPAEQGGTGVTIVECKE